ncbi:MAG: DUF523 domain-containing protein [Candidatus Hydrogenedentota bacterium]|nr:MAG: DUF523 domain-containing protein [Candidatus Hydrogenedentota bacterium]
MPQILRERIRIGVSACNFGAKVRWNRAGWDRIAPLEREKDNFIWTPVCPEVNSGLGVTRPPIRLFGGNGNDIWAGQAKIKNRGGVDVTDQMKKGLAASLEVLQQAGVEAFVFMEGSPTCGVYRTTLKNRRLGKPPGAFGSLLLREDYFLIPAEDLDSPVKWWDWRRRLHAFAWLRRQELSSKKQLYEIWHLLKFMCQEVSRKEADEIGRRLASMPRSFSRQFADDWRRDVLALLRKPSTFKRISSIMLKHYAHYRKHFNPSAKDVVAPMSTSAKRAFVRELHEMEKRAVLEDFDFGGAPVIFRAR